MVKTVRKHYFNSLLLGRDSILNVGNIQMSGAATYDDDRSTLITTPYLDLDVYSQIGPLNIY